MVACFYVSMNLCLLLFSCLIVASAFAGEPMRGPLPDEQQEIIQRLADQHEAIQRSVEWTDTGYRARTTSDDPEVASMLIAHVRYMKARLDSGARVRNWDPAFSEFAAHYEQLKTKIQELPNGLEVEIEGENQYAFEIAQNHGRIVSGFVSEGQEAVARKHEAVGSENANGKPKSRQSKCPQNP